MGTYWNGIKTKFSEIDSLKNRINESDFDYLELIEHPASQELDFSIKTTQIIKNSTPIEYGNKYFSVKEREFYNTFFFHLFWTTFDEEDEPFINTKRYTKSSLNDDLGWLKLEPNLYWKAFSQQTLSNIVDDFEKLNFDVIKKSYELERSESKIKFLNDPNFDSYSYQLEVEETVVNFVNLTKDIIDIYKNCISEKKDLIIEFI